MNIFPYFIGSLVTVLVIFITNKFIKNIKNDTKIRYSQTYIYNLMKPFIGQINNKKIKNTQAREFEKAQYIPVVMVDGQAYWILDNTLFTADQINGVVDKETTRPVDTMTMNKVQLDKTIFIVKALTEGAKDDSWDSGNQKF